MIDGVVQEQLADKYTPYELVEALDLSIEEVIDAFEMLIEDSIETLLDKSRGIGL